MGGGGGYESMLLRHWEAQIIPNVLLQLTGNIIRKMVGRTGEGGRMLKLTNCKIKTVRSQKIDRGQVMDEF
jgi:hypothetical protein